MQVCIVMVCVQYHVTLIRPSCNDPDLTYVLETIRCRKWILDEDMVGGCGYAASWCDLDLTVTFKILSSIYLKP